MKDNKEYVKIYQIAYELVSKYGFSTQVMQQYSRFINVELWLMNVKDPDYQIIRVTTNRVEDFKDDEERVSLICGTLSTVYKKQLKFLDIHITDEPYYPSLEKHDHMIINKDYSVGTDLRNIYPEIYQCIDEEADPDKEMKRFMDLIQRIRIRNEKQKPFFQRNTFSFNLIIIAVCTIFYLISAFMIGKYPDSAVYVFLGADYGTFTKGLHQYWRILTSAFLHGGFLHLVSNMYSLLIIGRYLERRMGKRDYLISLLVSILTASLTQDILSENTITLGISGGIYGLLVILIVDLLHRKVTTISSFIPLIAINLMINLLDNTAWIAHLGGLVAGCVMYFYMTQDDKKGPSVLIAVMLLCLFVKYATMKTIDPFYMGTDMQVVKMWNDLGFKDHALALAERLYDVYKVYGG